MTSSRKINHEHKEEGSGEWGVGEEISLSIPHSPLPTPFFFPTPFLQSAISIDDAASLLRRGRLLSLLVARVITPPRARDQFAGTWRIDVYLDSSERAVLVAVGRVIANDVLCAQVFCDLGGD